MSWCFQDEANPYADAVLDILSESTAFVPSIWPLEVINVLLVAERRKRITEANSVRFTTLLSQLPIVVEYERLEQLMEDALALARVNKLSSYHASYLGLAMRKGLPLATLDKRLTQAAMAVDVKMLRI
ncbi:MAG: type II toxin-antitoxin system VapC family toxin [Deltaproteobacteria bacterium]|nr:type II toxin-antitoxin system VapC family toxin [Deltaproteobacteria bacterium]